MTENLRDEPARAGIGARWLIANLACEEEFAGRAHAALPRSVGRRLAETALLLRVFAAPGDTLWLPAPLEDSRGAEVDGIATPRQHVGAAPPPGRAAGILAWGETESVARLRSANAGTATAPSERAPETALLSERLWRVAPPAASAARAANDRRLALAANRALGTALPGARTLHSLEELRSHLDAGGARAAPDERWVLKACHSAAGRDRFLGAGRDAGEPALARRVERFFERHGALVFEPWMERLLDAGAAALAGPERTVPLGSHRQRIDRRGGFLGLALDGADAGGALTVEESRLLGAALQGAGERLRGAGYQGPFGIDAWRYRDAAGAIRFHALGEINARLTVGIVLRAWHEHLLALGVISRGDGIRLAYRRQGGTGEPHAGRVIPLVLRGDPPHAEVWIEVLQPERADAPIDCDSGSVARGL